ncbi:MAG: DNA topoisomerase III [Clostridiales bacterium]|jgi:DNA topoisomerase-3|nr:DNA topoisomerase III [Clostridiales bacterium]
MSKTLVLAEKPSVGREIARVLGCRQSGNGCLIGPRYIVTWALGHLVELAQPETYGDQYKTWSLETLPMMPEKMELTVIPQTSKQYSAVKKLLHDPQVSSLVIATDAGREGELVARWILQKAGFHKPIQRLWISSQTDRAIRDGFAHLRDGRDYINLYQSAQSRAEADWLVGLNVTRALTCKHNAQLSAGRVQTPTLAMIVRREEEIRRFTPKNYYNVRADLGPFFAAWHDANRQTALFDKQKAQDIVDKIKGQTFRITQVKKTDKSTPPPMLYDLTELQRDASKQYQYSPKQTLNIMQRLYENHKALTYPRTDSRYLTADIVPTLPERLRAISFGEFSPLVSEVLRNNRTIYKACVNNAKVSDHHAIIPTEERVNLINMNNDEKRIYLMVVKRFLMCFFPHYQYRTITAELEAAGERFSASGREEINLGFKRVQNIRDEEEDEEQVLPSFRQGDRYSCKNTLLKELKTSPPARYTEATLLSAMENPSQFIEDKQMKEYIGGGLGTPATRADIIEKLFSSFYVEKQGTSIVPTSKGMQLINLVPQDLKEPLLTAKWERRLEAISRGAENKGAFLSEIRSYTRVLVKNVAGSDVKYVHDNITREICPECGKFLLMVNSKKGKMLVCQDRECGYRRNVMMQTRMRCPNCHKSMELYGEGDNRTYVCRCGFRQKADKMFAEKKNQKGASKQEVRRYLNQQKKDESGTGAFAAAWAKMLEEQGK